MLDKIKAMIGAGGPGEDSATSTLWTTPWIARSGTDLYVGHDGSVWLYGELPLSPVTWEDPGTRLQIGGRLQQLLREVGATSRPGVAGIRTLTNNRNVHLVSVTYTEPARPPQGTPAALADYQRGTLGFLVPNRVLLVGVQLRASGTTVMGKNGATGFFQVVKSLAERLLAEDLPDLQPYEKDRALISSVFGRSGAHAPTPVAADQLESWYNNGRGPDATIVEDSSSLLIAGDRVELGAVMSFERPFMTAPHDQWLAELLSHEDAPFLVSIRGQLEPSVVTRSRARSSQRRVNASIEEELSTGDLERAELTQTFQLAKSAEDLLMEGGEPVLSSASIIMARRVSDVDETYIDYLRERWGIRCKPLEHRQLAALDETLPASQRRVNPFLQDVMLPMLAYCGLHASSDLGDGKGGYVGLVDPFLSTCYLDYLSAPANDASPVLGPAGRPVRHNNYIRQPQRLRHSRIVRRVRTESWETRTSREDERTAERTRSIRPVQIRSG